MDRRVLRFALLGAALATALLAWRLATRPAPEPMVLRVERPLMGTLWTFEVAGPAGTPGAARAIAAAIAEVERIEALMSEWREGSPLSALNRAAGGEAVETPAELRAILERGKAYGEKSGGAFDITWRGMGRIWRFDDGFRVPDRAEIDAARRRVDYRRVAIDGNRVRLQQPGMAIGLGGIAKGYGVDRACEVLKAAGFPNHLVAGAGDIRAGGTKHGEPWRVGVQDPRAERGVVLGRVLLTGGAISTSGDYERFRMVDGVRYHHLIDPRTGYPASKSRAVTVLAGSAEQADALATSIFVLGPDDGLALARREGVDALVIDPEGRRQQTEGFRRRFETAPGRP